MKSSTQFKLEFDEITLDVDQSIIATKLRQLGTNLIILEKPSRGWLSRLIATEKPDAKGIYIWGGVGRGKTLMMDKFYENLAVEKKIRLHFHRFMVLVHDKRKELADTQNPMQEVADFFADWASVICLDEIYIEDIVDAMIMDKLLQQLFKRGVTLVMTSNFKPDQLYTDGLKRERFLPAIRRIEEQMDICHLGGDLDYRMQQLREAKTWYSPNDEEADKALKSHYLAAIGVNQQKPAEIIINRRTIPVRRWTNGVVWFDFKVICSAPRSTRDHVEIARYFHTVLVQNIRQMTDDDKDVARRFISMIDEYYDRRVNLIVSAESPLQDIYIGKALAFEFQRTMSRLQEMQGEGYLAQIHRP